MTPDQAAWVRENVWPPSWLRAFEHIPSTFLACSCQRPPSVECQRGDHGLCRHDGHAINETVIQAASGRVAFLPEPYAHRSPVISGTNNLAWVWLAGHPCRELCNCVCHRPAPTALAPTDPLPAAQQLDLFAWAL